MLKRALFGALHTLGFHALRLGAQPAQTYFAHRTLLGREPASRFMQAITPQALPQATLAQRLCEVSRHRRFSTSQDWNAKRKAEPCALLTFDDAYADFLTVAQPLLEENRIPALFFVTTAPLRQDALLWFDQVYSSFATAADAGELVMDRSVKLSLDWRNEARRVEAAVKFCAALVPLSENKRREAVEELVSILGPGNLKPTVLYLSKEQLAKLAACPGVEIGSHTVTHPNLTACSDAELKHEMVESKRELEKITGQQITTLSFPNGAWDQRVLAAARAAGYTLCFSTGGWGMGDDYVVPRVNLGWGNDSEFAVKNSPLWEHLR